MPSTRLWRASLGQELIAVMRRSSFTRGVPVISRVRLRSEIPPVSEVQPIQLNRLRGDKPYYAAQFQRF